jgi:hypothetical protein
MIICFTEKPGKPVASPGTHRNEFPTRYSLAGCSPAAPASASLAVLILQPSAQPVQENPANGKCLNFPLSQKRAQPKLERSYRFAAIVDTILHDARARQDAKAQLLHVGLRASVRGSSML